MIRKETMYLVGAAMCLMTSAVLTGCAAPTALAGGGSQTVATGASTQVYADCLARTISVSGSGTASAAPDVALVDLGVESVKVDAAQAIIDSTQRMTAVMAAIETMEIEAKDVRTTTYSIWTETVTDDEGRPTGETRFHVVNQVQVRLHDLSRTGELLQQALTAGANSVGGVSFGVADPTILRNQARDRAIADALAKAQQLATGLGAQLGTLRQVTEQDGVFYGSAPDVYAKGTGGGGSVPISSGEFSTSVSIQVVFDIIE